MVKEGKDELGFWKVVILIIIVILVFDYLHDYQSRIDNLEYIDNRLESKITDLEIDIAYQSTTVVQSDGYLACCPAGYILTGCSMQSNTASSGVFPSDNECCEGHNARQIWANCLRI